MLKIFGHPASTCTRKVVMTLNETNTPYELTTVVVAEGEHKQQPHLGRQPFGQIPALDDEGFALYESRAMCRYIDGKAGGKLVPRDANERAVMEQWISIETSNFTPHAMKLIYHHVFKRAQDAAVLEAAGKGLEAALGVMEARLAKSPFLAGDQLTLADVCFMPYIDYAMGSPAKETFAKFPHVSSWWNKISERPAWQKTAQRAQ
jgi:glutathione S-transferase